MTGRAPVLEESPTVLGALVFGMQRSFGALGTLVVLCAFCAACSGSQPQPEPISGDGDPTTRRTEPPRGDGLRTPTLARANIRVGREVYALRCAGCHGADARQKRDDAADLSTIDWSAPGTTDAVLQVMIEGRGKMPAYGDRMPRQQLYDVIAYLQNLQAPETELVEPAYDDAVIDDASDDDP